MNQKSEMRTELIKTRLTPEERKNFNDIVRSSGLSQSEFIREAIFHTEIKITINKETSRKELKELIAQYGKIGSNLNQIARYLNQQNILTNSVLTSIKDCLSDMETLKFKIIRMSEDESWRS